MMDDRVTRINTKTGQTVQYLMPIETNARRVSIDNYGAEARDVDRRPAPGRRDEGRAARLSVVTRKSKTAALARRRFRFEA